MNYSRAQVLAAKRVHELVTTGELRELRELHGLSITAVASFVGVNQSTASRWESGERRPRPDHAAELLFLLRAEGA
jgi:DNA-binding transcriptional regulator YiaG